MVYCQVLHNCRMANEIETIRWPLLALDYRFFPHIISPLVDFVLTTRSGIIDPEISAGNLPLTPTFTEVTASIGLMDFLVSQRRCVLRNVVAQLLGGFTI